VIGRSVLKGLLYAKAMMVIGFKKEGWQPHAKAKSKAGPPREFRVEALISYLHEHLEIRAHSFIFYGP
jgi:hypothetical protein